jgi:adenylate kinase
MTLIMLGPPGAGKGTQAAVLSETLGIITVSTGHILRTAISKKSPVGIQAKKYMDQGLLVPDEIIIEIVKDFLASHDIGKGCILDGVPRNIAQAEMLERLGVVIDAAISLEVSDREIEERMSGRRSCPKCGAGYHIAANPPKKDNICDLCGEKLVIRDDDRPETVRRRLEVYHRETEPIIDFYASKGKLLAVDGTASIEVTSEKVVKALEMIQ